MGNGSSSDYMPILGIKNKIEFNNYKYLKIECQGIQNWTGLPYGYIVLSDTKNLATYYSRTNVPDATRRTITIDLPIGTTTNAYLGFWSNGTLQFRVYQIWLE